MHGTQMSRMAAAWLIAVACSGPAWPAVDGAALFAQHCAACHQNEGQGTVGLAPALKGAHWEKLGADRTYLPTVLLHGLSGPIVVNGERHSSSMPAFGPALDNAALAGIANHLQTTIQQRNDPPLTETEFQAVRESGGSPPKSREQRAKALK